MHTSAAVKFQLFAALTPLPKLLSLSAKAGVAAEKGRSGQQAASDDLSLASARVSACEGHAASGRT